MGVFGLGGSLQQDGPGIVQAPGPLALILILAHHQQHNNSNFAGSIMMRRQSSITSLMTEQYLHGISLTFEVDFNGSNRTSTSGAVSLRPTYHHLYTSTGPSACPDTATPNNSVIRYSNFSRVHVSIHSPFLEITTEMV